MPPYSLAHIATSTAATKSADHGERADDAPTVFHAESSPHSIVLILHSGAATTTLRGRATSLRHKGARIGRDRKAMAWLLQMQAAFALALQSASSAELCATRILELGQLVLEGKLAEDQLLNVLSGELPDLFTNDPPKE